MPKTRHAALSHLTSPLPVLLAAGVFFAVPGLAPAASPIGAAAPTPRQADDEEQGPLVLTADQINLIQVYEIDLKTEPRVRIDRDVLEAFLEDPAYEGRDGMPSGRNGARDFLRIEGWQQLALLFRMRAREYYGDVQVREEPETLRTWQRINARYINQYFARMFANKDLGEDYELRYQGRPVTQIPLLVRGRDAEALAYTNFYILTQMTVNGVPMIDRQEPEASILVQWGLPHFDADSDAPEVAGWRPEFRALEDEDPQRDALIEWIDSLVSVNANSQYGIEYFPAELRGDDEEN